MKRAWLLAFVAFVAFAVASAGCGGGDAVQGGPAGKPSGSAAAGAPPPPPPQPATTASAAAAAAAAMANMPPLPKRDFQERDFAESDINRDPFRGYATDLAEQNKKSYAVQRKVLVDRYALEELKLVGLVTGAPSRALLIDPTGFGWIAKVGDFVGKPELVHSGGPSGADVPINWRLDRIRTGDVVFIREDPSHPEIPPSTRVIALRVVEETASAHGPGVVTVEKQQAQ
jgi:type IV pilus assembly protein PilP